MYYISSNYIFCFVRRVTVYAWWHCYHSCGETQSGR